MPATRPLARLLALVTLLGPLAVAWAEAPPSGSTAESERGTIPLDSQGVPLNLDFEAGTLKDWHAEGDAFAGMPVEQVFVWDSIAGMPDDLSERHIELTAEHLVPALADL